MSKAKAAVKGKDKKAAAKTEEPSDLQLAVEELNEVCGFSPALDHTAKNIEEELKEVAGELKESDKLSDATWQYLESIGALPEWKQPKKNTKTKDNKEDDDMAGKGKGKKGGKSTKAAAPAKGKDKKASSGEKKPAKAMETDDFGFRPGCKKSLVMAAIAKGGAKYDKLKEKYGNQVDWAITETKERTGTVVQVDEKSGLCTIKKKK